MKSNRKLFKISLPLILVIFIICYKIYECGSTLANSITLFIGLSTIIFSFISIKNSNENLMFELKYENSKNAMINLIKLIQFISSRFSPGTRYEFIDYLLETNLVKHESLDILYKFTKSTKNRFTNDKEVYLKILHDFKKNNEIYYLEISLRKKLKSFMESKTALNNEDIEVMINIIKKCLRDDYEIIVD